MDRVQLYHIVYKKKGRVDFACCSLTFDEASFWLVAHITTAPKPSLYLHRRTHRFVKHRTWQIGWNCAVQWEIDIPLGVRALGYRLKHYRSLCRWTFNSPLTPFGYSKTRAFVIVPLVWWKARIFKFPKKSNDHFIHIYVIRDLMLALCVTPIFYWISKNRTVVSLNSTFHDFYKWKNVWVRKRERLSIFTWKMSSLRVNLTRILVNF